MKGIRLLNFFGLCKKKSAEENSDQEVVQILQDAQQKYLKTVF